MNIKQTNLLKNKDFRKLLQIFLILSHLSTLTSRSEAKAARLGWLGWKLNPFPRLSNSGEDGLLPSRWGEIPQETSEGPEGSCWFCWNRLTVIRLRSEEKPSRWRMRAYLPPAGGPEEVANVRAVAQELREIAAQFELEMVARAAENLSRNLSESPTKVSPAATPVASHSAGLPLTRWFSVGPKLRSLLVEEVERLMRQGCLKDLPRERVLVALTLTLVKGVCIQAPQLLRSLFDTAVQFISQRWARWPAAAAASSSEEVTPAPQDQSETEDSTAPVGTLQTNRNGGLYERGNLKVNTWINYLVYTLLFKYEWNIPGSIWTILESHDQREQFFFLLLFDPELNFNFSSRLCWSLCCVKNVHNKQRRTFDWWFHPFGLRHLIKTGAPSCNSRIFISFKK